MCIRDRPNAPRAFRTPLVPLIPVLGVLTCLGMMVFLPLDTWIRLVAWMMIGLDVYLYRGIKNSILGNGDGKGNDNKTYRITAYSGSVLTALLGILAYAHHLDVEKGANDTGLVAFAVLMFIIHIAVYIYYLVKKAN